MVGMATNKAITGHVIGSRTRLLNGATHDVKMELYLAIFCGEKEHLHLHLVI